MSECAFSVGMNGERVTIAFVGAYSVRTGPEKEIEYRETVTIFLPSREDARKLRSKLTQFLASEQ